MDVFLWTFYKFLECFFDVLQKFSKSSWKYWQNMFAKVSLCRWLFCKNNNTINCDDNNNQFPDTRAFAFTRQLMKWNFTWSIGTITSSICIAALPFYLNQSLDLQKNWRTVFANELLQIIETMQKLVVFKRWCNCSILCESCCFHNWPTLCGENQANTN